MFLLTLKLVFSFLIHFVKRSVYEVKRLVIRDNSCKDLKYSQFFSEFLENDCSIDHYAFQVKDTNNLLKLSSFKINGDMELNGKVEGLKNINIVRYNYCYKGSVLCTMAEFKASDLKIHYDGIIKLAGIDCLAFLMSAVFKNVKIQVKFKIYPFQRITFYLDDIRIDELKIKANVFGLIVISWIVNLIINYAFKLMSFIILCFVEFHTKCYLNKTFSKFYFSQDYVLEKVYKEMGKYTAAQIEPCLNHLAEIEIKREILLKKSKIGLTSHFYNLLTGLFEFNKAVNKGVITQFIKVLSFNGNFNDFLSHALYSETSESDLSSAKSSESESSSTSSFYSRPESEFDNSGLGQEKGINSNENSSDTETYSISVQCNSNNETVYTISETSSENEVNFQNANDSCDVNNSHLEENYNESETQSENDSCKDINMQFEESCNERESQLENDSRDESSIQSGESCIASKSKPECESSEKISYQNYQTRKLNEENNNQSERTCNKETFNQPESNSDVDDSQPDSNSNGDDSQPDSNSNGDDSQPDSNSNDDSVPEISRNNHIHPEINCKPETDTQPMNSFYVEDDTESENINGDDATPPGSNIIGEDVTQPENNSNNV